MSETKPQRPEPVLQPMKIVQVSGPAPSLGMPANVNIPDPKPGSKLPVEKKSLVRSKKEIEAEQRRAKPNAGIPYNFPGPETNTAIVGSDLDRNKSARINLNAEQQPEYDEQWLECIDGIPVSRAWLQTAVSISGYISSEGSFTSQNIRGLTMTWKDGSLWCQIIAKGIPKTFLIPSANIKIMEFR